MKLRISRAEISFHIAKLEKKGYIKVSCETKANKYTVVLRKDGDVKVLTYTSNGWLNIE